MFDSNIKNISNNVKTKRTPNCFNIELILILFVINVLLNIKYTIKLFSLDDLYTCIEFRKMGFWEMVFNTLENKFRPVYYFVLEMCYKLLLPNVILFSVLLLILNFIVVLVLFFTIKKITNNSYFSFVGSVIYLFSRFSYYSITQVHGIMEQMGLLTAVLILMCLYIYINEGKQNYFYAASVLLFFIPFIHERYMTLFVLLILAIFLSQKSSKKFNKLNLLLFASLVFLANFFIRFYKLRGRSFDGTGGTNIKETFNVKSSIEFFLQGIEYLLGINAGPAYLSGIDRAAVPGWVYFFNTVFIVCILFISISFIIYIFKNKSKAKVCIKNVILFLAFIFITLASACVTIRLEMRWVYTPYVGFVILLLYMLSKIDFKEITNLKNTYRVIAIVLVCAIIPMELFFRINWKNIYYWAHYQLYNSAYEQIVERYKEEAFNKEIIIVSKHCDVFGENGEALNESLKIATNGRGFNIKTFESLEELPNKKDVENRVIFTIDPYYQKLINAE